jgi:tetratricopeptide (TPR) repeat protein
MHLTVFRSGFERAAAEAVAQATLPLLLAMVDKSLLTQTETGRYQMHDLLHQYASEELPLMSKLSARDEHMRFFLRLAEEADAALHGPEQLVWLDRLEAEHGNIQAALEWALTRERPYSTVGIYEMEAMRLASSLGLFWDLRGHFTEGRQWLEQILAVTGNFKDYETKLRQAREEEKQVASGEVVSYLKEVTPSSSYTAAQSQALYWAGHIAKWQGDYGRAAELADINLALCRGMNDPWRLGYALYLSGSVANKQGDLDRAKTFLDESLRLFRLVRARWGLAHTLGTLGNIARAQGRDAEALALLEESHEIYRALGDRRGLARSLNRLWHWPYRQGNYARATALLEEAKTLFAELKHRDGVAIILRHLGLVAQAQGDFAQARRLYEDSRALFQELGDKDDLAVTTWYLGRLSFYERNLTVAIPLLTESAHLAREVGTPSLIAWVLITQASVARYQAHFETARMLLVESLALARQARDQDVMADVLNGFAALAVAQGNGHRGAMLFGAAEGVRRVTPEPVVRAEHAHHLAMLRAQIDDPALQMAWDAGRQMAVEEATQLASVS